MTETYAGRPEQAGEGYTSEQADSACCAVPAENTFPALPVREGEYVFVWFAYQTALTASQAWTTSLLPALKGWLAGPEEVLELVPTRRSLLRHPSV